MIDTLTLDLPRQSLTADTTPLPTDPLHVLEATLLERYGHRACDQKGQFLTSLISDLKGKNEVWERHRNLAHLCIALDGCWQVATVLENTKNGWVISYEATLAQYAAEAVRELGGSGGVQTAWNGSGLTTRPYLHLCIPQAWTEEKILATRIPALLAELVAKIPKAFGVPKIRDYLSRKKPLKALNALLRSAGVPNNKTSPGDTSYSVNWHGLETALHTSQRYAHKLLGMSTTPVDLLLWDRIHFGLINEETFKVKVYKGTHITKSVPANWTPDAAGSLEEFRGVKKVLFHPYDFHDLLQWLSVLDDTDADCSPPEIQAMLRRLLSHPDPTILSNALGCLLLQSKLPLESAKALREIVAPPNLKTFDSWWKRLKGSVKWPDSEEVA